MPAVEQKEQLIRTFLDDVARRKQYEDALAEATAEVREFQSELDACERLSEEDFVVRINAKD